MKINRLNDGHASRRGKKKAKKFLGNSANEGARSFRGIAGHVDRRAGLKVANVFLSVFLSTVEN